MDRVTVANPVEREARIYLEDQAYTALLNYKEPVRSADIIGSIGNEQYSTKLVRHVLASSSRFASIDRRWDLEIRYEDKQRPLERILKEIVAAYGRPITIDQASSELSSVYERDAAFYESVVSRLFSDESRYFAISGKLFGLATWLLDATFDDEEDIIFYNALTEEEVSSYKDAAAKVDWATEDIETLASDFIKVVGSPVSNKIIGIYRWRAVGDTFDAIESFDTLFHNSDFVWLSDGRWANREMVKQYDAMLDKMADALAEDIADELPVAVAEKSEAAEEAAPVLSLTISERDIDEVLQIVSAKGVAKMPAILESIFEISPRDPIYSVAAEGLSDAMRADSRFVWVGTERWRMADTIPESVRQIPAELAIPELFFESPEGERLDVELEDDGLEGGLDVEIHNPLVQDIRDRDQITELDKAPASDSARCVVTRHHLKLKTFPLCQIARSFLPGGPAIIELTFIEGDKKNDVWVNRETGLIYGMDKWYTDEMPESGALFTLQKTQKQDEYQFAYNNSTDPLVAVAPNRIQELLELAEEAKTHDLSTFDLMTRIMPYHRKGISYVTLFTEVNIVRRTTRRLVASILSSYYAFYQRPKSALWHFDEKKVDQGFKKAKRKYVRKG